MTADVTFRVLDVTPDRYALTPILAAELEITAADDQPIQAIALRCQVRIAPLRRTYTDEEAAGLLDLFGPRERWSATQHGFVWLNAAAMVPGFIGTTRATLPLQCTYDVEVSATKYFHALDTGGIPLEFLFSGTIFDEGRQTLQVRHVSWDCEDSYDMPVAVWRALVAQHYPATGWVRLSHDTIAALCAFRSAHGLLSVDEAVDTLLASADQQTLCANGSPVEAP